MILEAFGQVQRFVGRVGNFKYIIYERLEASETK